MTFCFGATVGILLQCFICFSTRVESLKVVVYCVDSPIIFFILLAEQEGGGLWQHCQLLFISKHCSLHCNLCDCDHSKGLSTPQIKCLSDCLPASESPSPTPFQRHNHGAPLPTTFQIDNVTKVSRFWTSLSNFFIFYATSVYSRFQPYECLAFECVILDRYKNAI